MPYLREKRIWTRYFVVLLSYKCFIDWDTYSEYACSEFILMVYYVIINGCILRFGLGRLHSFELSSLLPLHTLPGSPLPDLHSLRNIP